LKSFHGIHLMLVQPPVQPLFVEVVVLDFLRQFLPWLFRHLLALSVLDCLQAVHLL
jgi:hypothetical protein